MKRIIFLLLVVASTSIAAQTRFVPLCMPKEVPGGTGSSFVVGEVGKYRYLSYYCPGTTPQGIYNQVTFVGEKKAAIKAPGVAGLSVAEAIQKHIDANVLTSVDLKDKKYDGVKAEINLRLSMDVVWPPSNASRP